MANMVELVTGFNKLIRDNELDIPLVLKFSTLERGELRLARLKEQLASGEKAKPRKIREKRFQPSKLRFGGFAVNIEAEGLKAYPRTGTKLETLYNQLLVGATLPEMMEALVEQHPGTKSWDGKNLCRAIRKHFKGKGHAVETNWIRASEARDSRLLDTEENNLVLHYSILTGE